MSVDQPAENASVLLSKRLALPPRWTLERLLGKETGADRSARSLSVIAVCMIIICVAIVGFALFAARPILLPFASAIILATLLTPIADRLGRFGLPEGASAAATVLVTLAMLIGAALIIDKPTIEWAQRLPQTVEAARDKLSGVTEAVSRVREATQEVEQSISELAETAANEVVVKEQSMMTSLAGAVREASVQILFTVVLVYFLLAGRTSFRIKAMAAQPTLGGKLQVARIFRDVRRKVGQYMLTMTAINIGLGAAVALAMAALDMPSPIVWGVLAAVLNFVPYIGPAAVTVLLAASGVVTFDTLQQAALAPLAYIVLNFIESNVVTPSLIGVRMMLSPLAIMLFVAILAWIWGPVGAVIAAPLLVIIKSVCDSVGFLQPVGVLVGEIQIVKERKIGFCRVDTILKRPRYDTHVLDEHIVESRRRAAQPKPKAKIPHRAITAMRRKVAAEDAAAKS